MVCPAPRRRDHLVLAFSTYVHLLGAQRFRRPSYPYKSPTDYPPSRVALRLSPNTPLKLKFMLQHMLFVTTSKKNVLDDVNICDI